MNLSLIPRPPEPYEMVLVDSFKEQLLIIDAYFASIYLRRTPVNQI